MTSAARRPADFHVHQRLEWLELRLLAAVDAGDDGGRELSARTATCGQRLRRYEAKHPDLPGLVLRDSLGLCPLEEDVLWLAAGCRMDHYLAELCANVLGDVRRDYVSPWLCLRVLCDGRRERLDARRMLTPEAPLLRSGLIELVAREGGPLLSEVAPPAWVVGYLGGERTVEPALAGIVRHVRPELTLDHVVLRPDDRRRLDRVVSPLARRDAVSDPVCGPAGYDFQRGAAVLITGESGAGKTLLARALCGHNGQAAIEIDADRLSLLPAEASGRAMVGLFQEAAATGDWLLFDAAEHLLREVPGDNPFSDQRLLYTAFRSALQRFPVMVLVTSTSPDNVAPALRDRLFLHHELRPASRELVPLCWQLNVPGDVVVDFDVDFQRLADDAALTGRGVQNALNIAIRGLEADQPLGQAALQAAAELQRSPGLGNVAKRTWVQRSREDLLLPEDLMRQVEEIIATERIREAVLHDWKLEARMNKGLGLICLLDGEPGTGKTLTAEVIASELGIPLYTVNVGAVVSKWIGETEKNLQRIFDEAQRNRCVLLFDEADTLFSKRTEVSRAVDRYSNMEVGLLLQLVEAYRGLVLLTTNLKESIDVAFNRRIAFKLGYPFPEAGIREKIWARLLPMDRLADDVDLEELGRRFELAGGSIRTVVLRAAYRSAVAGEPIRWGTLCECAIEECRALGKLVRDRGGD